MSNSVKRRSNAKAKRNQNILIDATKGASGVELAAKYKLAPETVSRILNSDEMKAIVKRGESRIHELVDRALAVIAIALDSADEKLATDTAVRIAKSVGALKDKVDISHSYPKPTVVIKPDGSRVVMGVSEEEDDNE